MVAFPWCISNGGCVGVEFLLYLIDDIGDGGSWVLGDRVSWKTLQDGIFHNYYAAVALKGN